MRIFTKPALALVLFSSSVLLNSCGSLFSGNGQTIVVTSGTPDAEIYHQGKKVGTGMAKVRVKRTDRVQEFVIKGDSLKERHATTGLEYRRGTEWLNLILLPTLYGALYGFTIDKLNSRTYRYPSKLYTPPLVAVPHRKANQKYILINKTSADISEKDTIAAIYSGTRRYKEGKVYSTQVSDEKIEYSNTIFEDHLNELLKSNGYIDTVAKLFPTVGNTLYVNSKLTKYKFDIIFPRSINGRKGTRASAASHVRVEWEVLDVYKRSLFKHTSSVVSDMFLITDMGDNKNLRSVMQTAAKDGLEYALLDLQAQPGFKKICNMEAENAESAKAFKALETIGFAKPVPTPDVRVNDLLKSGVTVKVKDGHGSGFFVSKDGHIITNFHVVANSEKDLQVILNDGTKLNAEIVRTNDKIDLALIKIEGDSYKPLLLADDEPEVGVEVLAIGTPKTIELGQSVSKGIISGLRKVEDKSHEYIQTDVAVNPGNSGGALITRDGTVRGIVTAGLSNSEGVNFAIPAREVFGALKISYGSETKPAPAAATPVAGDGAKPAPAKAPAKVAPPVAKPAKANK